MSDNEDPTEDMVKREVAEAARILREDFGVKTMREMFQSYFGDPKPKSDEMVVTETESAPPQKPEKDSKPKKKSSMWWGDALEE